MSDGSTSGPTSTSVGFVPSGGPEVTRVWPRFLRAARGADLPRDPHHDPEHRGVARSRQRQVRAGLPFITKHGRASSGTASGANRWSAGAAPGWAAAGIAVRLDHASDPGAARPRDATIALGSPTRDRAVLRESVAHVGPASRPVRASVARPRSKSFCG